MNIFLWRGHYWRRDYFTARHHYGLQLAYPTGLAPQQVSSIVKLYSFARSGPDLRLL
jgi:hypothetical protein